MLNIKKHSKYHIIVVTYYIIAFIFSFIPYNCTSIYSDVIVCHTVLSKLFEGIGNKYLELPYIVIGIFIIHIIIYLIYSKVKKEYPTRFIFLIIPMIITLLLLPVIF